MSVKISNHKQQGPFPTERTFGGGFAGSPLGGMGGVSFWAQLVGSLLGAGYAFLAGGLVYLVLKFVVGIRLTDEEEHAGADLSIHKIGAYPEDDFVRSR